MSISIEDMKAAFALGMEQALKLVTTGNAPAIVQEPPVAKKRKGNPEALRKYREQQKSAKATKPKATKPKAEKPVEAVKAPAPAWTVRAHKTAKGSVGKIVTVGPFSAWIPDGDTKKADACVTAINTVFRSAVCGELVAAIRK